MRTKKSKLIVTALTFAALPLAVNQALAAEYWLQAAPFQMADPNGGAPIAMWGYSQCESQWANCGAPSAPGPVLSVPVGDSTLTVYLKNLLSAPTSLVINGLIKPMAPVWTEPGSNTPMSSRGTSTSARVRSFDAEVAAGDTTGSSPYIWYNVKPGTYLYQSGTQPQVQVQMGLYGAVTKNAVAADPATSTRAEAYPGLAYDNQATLLYSEIDPALHEAVGGTNPTYGTTGPTSTLNYAPKYFLINGKVYPDAQLQSVATSGFAGKTLLRLLNAGLTTHVPTILGKHWEVVAEDGKPYPYSRTQYTALLPAAKTMDVLLTLEDGVKYPIMDSRLSLSNNGASDGGMMAFLLAGQGSGAGAAGAGGGAGSGTGTGSGTGNVAPVAENDTYDSVQGVTFNIAAPGVLANDTDANSGQALTAAAVPSGTTAKGGAYTLLANGSFTYKPLAGFMGVSDTFTYRAKDPHGALSAEATVTIKLNVPTAPTLGVLDNFDRADSTNSADGLGANWSQAASSSEPGPNLRVASDGTSGRAVVSSTGLGGQAIWNAAPFGATQGAAFASGTPLENSALVLKATGGTLVQPANFIRVRCELANGGEVAIYTYGGTYTKEAAIAAPGCSSSGSLSAVVDAKGLVTTFLNGNFAGGVQLSANALWMGGGRVGTQLQTLNATIDDFAGGDVAP